MCSQQNIDKSIVFFGTPDFAVGILDAIINSGIRVAAIVTAPDRPAGRGKRLTPPAVKQYAIDKFTDSECPPILQPEKLRDETFLSLLRSFEADVFFVVAFRMLPKEVWTMPQLGTVNLHASLLPDYRGAAPINRAIMDGETISGLTTFLIDDKIDTGNILMRCTCPINIEETAGELHDKLMEMGGDITVSTIHSLFEGKISGQPQTQFVKDGYIPKQAPKIFPEECFINWNTPALAIYNFVRGLSPYPGARTILFNGDKSLMCKILRCVMVESDNKTAAPIGTIITDNRHIFRIACAEGYIDVTELQLEGKRQMTTEEFLLGFTLSQWSIKSPIPDV